MEQLDHRQLLSVNFTGIVQNDFPASQSPGVVVLPDNPNVIHPNIAPALQATDPATGIPYVPQSGFNITGIRVSYDSADDTLSVGIDQPPSGRPGDPLPVIAGDADGNGNDGTVNPGILTLPGFSGFMDFPDFGGSETMAVFLDLTGSGSPDVVAGYAQNDPRSPKQYQVAQAVVNPGNPSGPPSFGTMLPQFTGNVYKVNSPQHPGLEFDINHFSQLYFQETGKTLNPKTTVSMGAFAGSADDIGISEAFFPPAKFSIGPATQPPHCPPVSPPILINPHEGRHINTAHPTLIRATVLGSSGFDVTQIDPATVTLGGAHPVFSFTRHVVRSQFLDETFVFEGDQVKLPPGITRATLSGSLRNGTLFSTSEAVFNRDSSFYSPGQVQAQQARWAARGGPRPDLPNLIAELESHPKPGVTFTSPLPGTTTPTVRTPHTHAVPAGPVVHLGASSRQATAIRSDNAMPGPVISIKKRPPKVVLPNQKNTPHISPRLNSSMNHFIEQSSGGSGGGGGAA